MSSCSHRIPSPIREFNTLGPQHKSEDGQKILRDHDFPKNWVLLSVYVFLSSTLKFKKYFYERKKEINILSLIHNGRTQTKQNNNINNNNNNITTTLAVRPIKERKLKFS